VARNDLFQGLVKMIASVALDAGADVGKILAARVGDRTVADAITETIAKVGENMTLRRAAALSVGKGIIASYVHSSVADGLGRIGVIVALESAGNPDELKAFGRMVAMHVASANPQAIDASGLDAATIEREKNVLAEKFKAQGKPANVIDKIVESGLRTFYKEVCLLDQGFIFDDKKSVAQALKESEAKAGAPIRIGGFVRFALGEGIDRPEGDFGGEVAALAGTH
jgi:elongation factor Ts